MRFPNLDLVRLLAASQVAVIHVAWAVGWKLPQGIAAVLHFFPGVPIFFS